MKPIKLFTFFMYLVVLAGKGYAAMGAAEPPLRGPALLVYLEPGEVFRQRRVLANPRYQPVLEAEGLGHLIPSPAEIDREYRTSRSYIGWALDGVYSGSAFVWENCISCCCRRHPRHRRLDDIEESRYLSPCELIKRRKELEEELIANMSSKRRDAMHRALLEPVFQGGMTIGMLLAAQPFLEDNEFASGIASLWMFGTGLDYGKKLLSALYQIHVSPFADDLYEPMKRWSAIKRYFPIKFQDFVERKIGVGLRNPFNLGPVVDFMRTVVDLPVRGKPVKSLTFASNYDFRILRERLRAYPAKVIGPIMTAMVHHAYRSSSHHLPPALDTRPVMYFEGPAGTGKTTIARFIAAALGVPFIQIQFSGPTTGIIGTESDPGRLLNALTRSGNEGANAVLLLDEAGALLREDNGADMGDFLQIFDPNVREIRMPYLGEPIDFRRFLVIATGNHKIANEALRNRVIRVNFSEIEPEHKRNTTMDDLDSAFGAATRDGMHHRGRRLVTSTPTIEIMEERSPLPSLSDLYTRTREDIRALIPTIEDKGMRLVHQAVRHVLIGHAAVALGLISKLPDFLTEQEAAEEVRGAAAEEDI